MAEHLPYYGHEQGCYNSKIPWGPEPCSGCVSLRRAFSQGQRDEREACIAAVEGLRAVTPNLIRRDDALAAIRAREEKPSASDVFPLTDYEPRSRGTEDGDE